MVYDHGQMSEPGYGRPKSDAQRPGAAERGRSVKETDGEEGIGYRAILEPGVAE